MMRAHGLIGAVSGLFWTCSFSIVAAAAGGSTSCSGVSAATIKLAQGTAEAEFCTDAGNCAANSGDCSQKALRVDGKAILSSLETKYSLSQYCAGAILAQLALAVVDGKLSSESCAP